MEFNNPKAIYYSDWPNRIRKIWYDDNGFGFRECQEETIKNGFVLRYDNNLKEYIEPSNGLTFNEWASETYGV